MRLDDTGLTARRRETRRRSIDAVFPDAVERLVHGQTRRWALAGVTLQHLMNEVRERGRQIRPNLQEVFGVALHTCKSGIDIGLTDERNTSREAFVENETE